MLVTLHLAGTGLQDIVFTPSQITEDDLRTISTAIIPDGTTDLSGYTPTDEHRVAAEEALMDTWKLELAAQPSYIEDQEITGYESITVEPRDLRAAARWYAEEEGIPAPPLTDRDRIQAVATNTEEYGAIQSYLEQRPYATNDELGAFMNYSSVQNFISSASASLRRSVPEGIPPHIVAASLAGHVHITEGGEVFAWHVGQASFTAAHLPEAKAAYLTAHPGTHDQRIPHPAVYTDARAFLQAADPGGQTVPMDVRIAVHPVLLLPQLGFFTYISPYGEVYAFPAHPDS